MNLNISSQISFLYFKEYDKAVDFLGNTLGLELVFDPGWAAVFRTSKDAFIGAVDEVKGSIEVEVKGGTLISITVENVHDWYEKLKKETGLTLTEIKTFEDIGLKSFFFKGPEGYDFEIQEFYNEELRKIF